MRLTPQDHRRDIAGLSYIYPVISRRSGGLSIGINVNTNNACNWRCIYCQVPNLTRGAAPKLNLPLLEEELRSFLYNVLHGDFYERFAVPAPLRDIKDIAISGNGEPTSVNDFAAMVALVGDIAKQAGLARECNYVLITNGSLVHLPEVQQGLKALNEFGGQIWFKFDSATEKRQKLINNAAIGIHKHIANLITAARLCPTWIQTCVFGIDGVGWPKQERRAYLDLLGNLQTEADFLGVMLYTLARPSHQPEAPRLAKLEHRELQELASEIEALKFNVRISD
jgi:wyosine [tRNA(Phe)-imidazoG37] synthetase (radical SAM superfamily)